MHRRDVLLSIGALATEGMRTRAIAGDARMDEFEGRKAEIYAKAIADFPFRRLEVRGEDALSTWEKYKTAGQGVPVVIGDDESVVRLMALFDAADPFPWKSPAQIIDAAARIKIPEDLFARRGQEVMENRKATEELLSGPNEKLPTIIEKRDDQGHVIEHLIQ